MQADVQDPGRGLKEPVVLDIQGLPKGAGMKELREGEKMLNLSRLVSFEENKLSSAKSKTDLDDL